MTNWTALISLIVAYIAILAIATVIVQPFRIRLVMLADDMLAEKHWSKDERELLKFMSDNCVSSSVGVALPFAAAYSLALTITGGHSDSPMNTSRIDHDPRRRTLVRLFFISIGGASPFASLISAPLLALNVALVARRARHPIAEAMNAQLRQMSRSYQHC